jgi:predicted RNase H-like HicB family nuclease
MKKTLFAYPAHFINEDNGTVTVTFPDLSGCKTYGESLEDAVFMAKDALEGFIEIILENNETLPKPSCIDSVKPEKSDNNEKYDFEAIAQRNGYKTMLVVADIENIKSQTRTVKKTLSIPHWLNVAAEREHINFSGVLQEALKERLG